MEALHWIIASYLRWVLCHYLDDFVAIFKADGLPERLEHKANAYIWLTDLLGLPQHDFKDCQWTETIVLGIEIDTSLFPARLPEDKLEKAMGAILKVLSQKAVSFIDIQSLMWFLSFCSQAVRLGRIYMGWLWDFINHYPAAGLSLRLGEFQLGWKRIWSGGTSCSQNTTGSCSLIQGTEKLRLFIPTLVSTD